MCSKIPSSLLFVLLRTISYWCLFSKIVRKHGKFYHGTGLKIGPTSLWYPAHLALHCTLALFFKLTKFQGGMCDIILLQSLNP